MIQLSDVVDNNENDKKSRSSTKNKGRSLLHYNRGKNKRYKKKKKGGRLPKTKGKKRNKRSSSSDVTSVNQVIAVDINIHTTSLDKYDEIMGCRNSKYYNHKTEKKMAE
eukprot:162695_1